MPRATHTGEKPYKPWLSDFENLDLEAEVGLAWDLEARVPVGAVCKRVVRQTVSSEKERER